MPAVLKRVSSPARGGPDQGLAHHLVPEAVMPVHLPFERGHAPFDRTYVAVAAAGVPLAKR